MMSSHTNASVYGLRLISRFFPGCGRVADIWSNNRKYIQEHVIALDRRLKISSSRLV
jgi:hypothetical protein